MKYFVSYSTDVVAFSSAHFGAGVGSIHLNNIDCSGSEMNLTDCSHSSIVYCTNGHSVDAGVRCQGIALFPAVFFSQTVSIALFTPCSQHQW